MPLRLAQTITVVFLTLHAALLAFNNLIDYTANFTFVREIMSMSDIFDPARNNWRGSTNPTFHHIFLATIIIWEIVIAFLCGLGCIQQLRHLQAPDSQRFQQAKTLSFYGLILGLGLWLFAFLTVGGEWFLMWQSAHYNAQPTAFHLTTIYLLALVLLSQRSR